MPGSISTGIGHFGGLGPLGHLSAVASKNQTWTFGTLYLELLQRYADFFLPRSARAEVASSTPAPATTGAAAGYTPGSPPLPTRSVAAVVTTPSRTPGPGGLLGSVLEVIQHGHPPHTPASTRPGFGLSTPLATRNQAVSGTTVAPSAVAMTVLTSPYVSRCGGGRKGAAAILIGIGHGAIAVWPLSDVGGGNQRIERAVLYSDFFIQCVGEFWLSQNHYQANPPDFRPTSRFVWRMLSALCTAHGRGR